MCTFTPDFSKELSKDIFAQILQSNSHFNTRKTSNTKYTLELRHKRRFHPYYTWGRAKPDWRYGSCLRFLYVQELVLIVINESTNR